VFLPSLGLLGASLRHRGEELLGRTDELDRYVSTGSTMGIPLLHPWANRLAGLEYAAGGREVRLDAASPVLHFDGNGLPIHGVPGALLAWDVAERSPTFLRAQLRWDEPRLLAVFPFAHRLEQALTLAPGGLSVRTALTAGSEGAVPVSFGFHPYLRLPGVARADWRLELPPMRRLALDERGIPTGADEPFPGMEAPLGELALDDGFAGLPERPSLALAGGGRRLAVVFETGYTHAQVFAPPGKDYVALEPMTAPTNALATGDGMRLVAPGETFAAAFRLEVSAA
jgi:galactose mutarotase-like enzyme